MQHIHTHIARKKGRVASFKTDVTYSHVHCTPFFSMSEQKKRETFHVLVCLTHLHLFLYLAASVLLFLCECWGTLVFGVGNARLNAYLYTYYNKCNNQHIFSLLAFCARHTYTQIYTNRNYTKHVTIQRHTYTPMFYSRINWGEKKTCTTTRNKNPWHMLARCYLMRTNERYGESVQCGN